MTAITPILSLHHAQRAEVAKEAARRLRPLWPASPDGGLAHAVFWQLMNDLAIIEAHDSASKDWHYTGEHWYVEGMGVDRQYLHEQLLGWGFVHPNQPLTDAEHPAYDDPADADGEKVCRDCGVLKPLGEYHRNRSTKDGHFANCKLCRSHHRNKLQRKRNRAAKRNGGSSR